VEKARLSSGKPRVSHWGEVLIEGLEKHWRKIPRQEINDLPIRKYPGAIRLIASQEQVRPALERLGKESLLGFDTETRPAFRKGRSYLPSVVQLAASDAVYLFQLNGADFSDGLRDILASPAIVKTGVAVDDDIKGLQKLSPFAPRGFVDLGDVARRLGLKTNGLRNLTANFLGFRISKSAQRTNWAAPNLTPKQILYAATDAWVSRELHTCMERLGLLDRARDPALAGDRREEAANHNSVLSQPGRQMAGAAP